MRSVWLIALLAFVACGSHNRPAALPPKGQIILLDSLKIVAGGSDTVRFGHLHSGEIAVLPLVLQNNTRHPMLLTGYDRSCGCTTIDYENQPVKAGGMLPVQLTFDARGAQGWQFKLLTLRFAEWDRPLRIYVEAEVE